MKKYIILLSIMVCLGCRKLTQVPEPVNTITTTETFSTKANATSGLMAIYYDLANDNHTSSNGSYGAGFGNVLLAKDCGLSGDELYIVNGNNDDQLFSNNAINSSLGDVANAWKEFYTDIYIANAIIDGLKNSSTIDSATKLQLSSEAKFLRAYCFFYLVNLYGTPYSTNPNGPGVPLVTTTAYAINDTLRRATTSSIYQLIVTDLKDAKDGLKADYSISNGEKTRVNQAGAAALLARVFLYMNDFKNAEIAATSIINNVSYSLNADLNQVFLANSAEAILQWQPGDINFYPYTTAEGDFFLPRDIYNPPHYAFPAKFIQSFESGDKRLSNWIDTGSFSGYPGQYYFPYKYKVKVGNQGALTEYSMALRLAEQYLIRAEAEANGAGSGLAAAISDVNVIRNRAGLPNLSSSLTKDQVLAAIYQERKVELFTESGHRWFDLKRTGQAQTVLLANKGFSVSANQLLYPIPAGELILDNHLVQNPGY